jgi:6-phosphogluconolactonase (cycloisomerase 2 family)
MKSIVYNSISFISWLILNLVLTATSQAELEFVGFVQDGQGRVEGLDGAHVVALSPDDKFAYVASYNNTLTVLIRDPINGKVFPIQVIKDSKNGVYGLKSVNSVTGSADEKSVYVASSEGIAVFNRDPNNGQLTFQQILTNSQDGMVELDGAESVTVSADGKSVYVTYSSDDSVVVFKRDEGTGQLSFQQVIRDGQNGVDGLDGAESVTVSADGKSVYVASSGEMAVFGRDPNSGQLTFQQVLIDDQDGVDGLYSASSVTVSTDEKSVYVASWDDEVVTVFKFGHDPNSGQLTVQLTSQLTFEQDLKYNQDNVVKFEDARAQSITVSADGNLVYVAILCKNITYYDDSGTTIEFILPSPSPFAGSVAEVKGVAVFGRDPNTGQLTYQQFLNEQHNGANSITVSADGKSVYMANSSDNAVAVFGHDLDAGQLILRQTLKNGENLVDGLDGAYSITISADGKSVYVASRIAFPRLLPGGIQIEPGYDYDESVAVFGRDPNTGQLTFQQIIKDDQDGVDGLDGANSVTVSADGKSVYVTSPIDNAMAVFGRDLNTGQLTFQQVLQNGQNGIDGLDNANSVTVSVNNKSVYVASDYVYPGFTTGEPENFGVVFVRDPKTSQLTLQQVIKADHGLAGLDGANSVTMSADEKSVYYVDSYNTAVVAFERNPDSGQLTFQQVLKNGQNGVKVSGANLVTVSADNQSVYVASVYDDSLAVFKRDLSTGRLTFLQAFYDSQNGIDGLDGANSVTVSADGQSVYVASSEDDAVAVFGRDTHSGRLTYQQAIFDINQVNGLDGASSVVVSPDDHFVYVASQEDDAIAIFDRTNQPPQNTLPVTPIKINKNTDFRFEQLSIDDPDAGPLAVQVTLVVTPGTLTLSTTADLEFKQGDGTDDSQLIMTGTVAAFNHALKGMTFTPPVNFSGEATFQIVTNDLGYGYGGPKQASDTLTITVLPINESPVIEPLETQYSFPTKLLSFQVKATDPDVPQQNLTYELINTPPAGATIDSKTGQFSWTPLPNQIDTFEVTIQVTDDGINPDHLTATQTVNIIITDKPTIEPLPDQTITVGSPLTLAVTAHFPGAQALSFSLTDEAPAGAQIDSHTGVFTWTPIQIGPFTATVVVTEPVGQTTATTPVNINVIAIPTSLDLDLDSFAIFQNGDLTAHGQLKAYAPQTVNVSNLPIQLQITAPDGSLVTPTPTVNTTTGGQYQLANLKAFNQTGTYQLQAQFAENDRLAPIASTTLPLRVESLAGYALLVEGRDFQGNGQAAYGKSLNRVYQHLKNRGFTDPNIDYLSYEDYRVGVDEHPDKAKVQGALQALQTRLNNDPAPLYIVAVDHGDTEGHFYLDNGGGETISPAEFDNWLTTLEQGLTPLAKAQPRVIIIGACYSGNTIPALSKPGRTIITSAAADEASYKGPKEPDEVRSGEYFIEALFARFAQGQSLKTAFELATQSTELFTRANDFTMFHNQYQDNALQHPLLDDNSDRQGSNVLSSDDPSDGQAAKTIYLGLGQRYNKNAPDNPAEIWTVTPMVSLDANQTTTRLLARVNRPSRVKGQQVWVDIRPPTLQLTTDGTEQSESQEINGVIRHHLNLTSGNEFSSAIDGFTAAGRYEIFYFVIDSDTDTRSPLQSSVVYKDRAGNQPPTTVQLLNPKNNQESATTVIFNWQKSTDPNGDPLTYTFLLATEPSFQKIIYQQTGLIAAMTYLNTQSQIDDPLNHGQLGLRDGTEYAWKVQAIDQYGAMSESEVFTFRTNDTNAPPGLASLYVFNAVNFVSLENAAVDFWMVDEWGNIIYDDQGLPIPIPPAQSPDVFQDQGFYNMMLPLSLTPQLGLRRATTRVNGYHATIRVNGYQDKSILIDMTEGLANLQVAMTPQGGIPRQPGQLQFAVKQAQIEETRGEIALLVNRVNGKAGAISVTYELLPDGSASLGEDYSVAEGQLTWSDQDQSPQKIPLIIYDDDQAEGEESFSLRLSNPTGEATLGTPATLTITLIDDETTLPQNPGVLQFLTTHYAASESDSQPVITVTRTDGSEGRVAIQYLVTNESTARFNADYTGGTGTLTWDSGDDEPKRLQLTLIDDETVEDLETLHFTLLSPTKGASLGEHQSAILTITDNDVAGAGPGTVQFAQANYQAHEEDGSLQTVTVTRREGNQGQVTVQYQIAPASTATVASDYTLLDTGSLTWEDGDSEAKIIKIMIADDPEVEAAETVQLRLVNPTGGVVLGEPSQATLTIFDNDSITADKPNNSTSVDNPIELTPENQPTSGDKLNQPAVANQPTDTVGETTTLPDELGNPTTPTNANGTYSNSTATPAAGTLQFFTDTYYLNEGIGPVSAFTVIRSGGSQGTVSVEYTIVGGTAEKGLDYTGGSGLLTWGDGDEMPKAIDLKVLDDQEIEKAETLHIQLKNPTNNAQLGLYDQATLVITDNDDSTGLPTATATNQLAELEFTLPLYWAQEEEQAVQLTVTRTGSSQGEVSVQYIATVNSSATLGEDYNNGSGTLVWADGDTQPQTITLKLNDDELAEEEIIHLLLVQPTGAATLGKLNETIVIIQDDDTAIDPLSQVATSIQDSSEVLPPKPLLPNLGRGMALVKESLTPWQTRLNNCQALPCPLQVTFRGGSSLNGLDYYPQLTLPPYQYVNIRGEIDVAAEQVGQPAELLLVAAWKPLDSLEPERYFMQDSHGQMLPWDLNLAHLVARAAVTLTPTQAVSLYTGFLERGQIRLFFGYQLPDGVIVYNGEQAVELVVKELVTD